MVQKKKQNVKSKKPAVNAVKNVGKIALTEKQMISLDKFAEKIIARFSARIAKKAARLDKKKKGLGSLAKAHVLAHIAKV